MKAPTTPPSQWTDDRDPEVVIVCGKAGKTTHKANPEARTEVASRIDGISTVEAERGTNRHDQETNDQRVEVPLDRLVACINDGKDQAYEESSAYELVTEGIDVSRRAWGR